MEYTNFFEEFGSPLNPRKRKKLEEFLDQKQYQNRNQHGKMGAQANGQCQLGHFIRKRIQQFSYIGDHVIMPGDFTVHHIRQAGNGQNTAGKIVMLRLCGFEINI